MHFILNNKITLNDLSILVNDGHTLSVHADAVERVEKCKRYLETKIADPNAIFYGINTGFGSLCNVQIPHDSLSLLQENLVKSHACGTGDLVPIEIIRLIVVLKIQSLIFGHSGVRIETVNRLVDMYNQNVMPVIYEQGSLGASGDLAPLAHLSLTLLGCGEVYWNGSRQNSESVLTELGWQPLILEAKEGLALLNGTQFMSAYLAWSLIRSKQLFEIGLNIASLSVDGFDGRYDAFAAPIHNVRPHFGQKYVAKRMLELLEGSEIGDQRKVQVQDPYSFRCIPQVLGASYDTIAHVLSVAEIEWNSVSDNPLIFPDEDLIVSGGNFHGQPLAIALDSLAIALAEIGSISERRTYLLISGQRNLPAFLVAEPGLNSGLMIHQYTAASIVSQSKQLCTPASVDSITSSNGQEDHVSMGANAATKCVRVVNNLANVLGIELINASQALYFREKQTSKKLQTLVTDFRKVVEPILVDRIASTDIHAAKNFIERYTIA